MTIPADIDLPLINECYGKSLELLRQNMSESGILAATRNPCADSRSYTSIFGRDAGISTLGMLASEDEELIRCARAGLVTLAQAQAPNGQIPKFVRPETGEIDFWYSGCIDATLWWLIAVHQYDRCRPLDRLGAELADRINAALQWLSCQEHQTWYLLQQNEASDWADIMPRSGFVLYTNALWYWLKRLYDLPTRSATREHFNLLFNPFGPVVPGHRRLRLLTHYIRNRTRKDCFYLSYVNFSHWGGEIDLFGNVLALLAGVCDGSTAGTIARRILDLEGGYPFPLRVVGRPITREDRLWRRYMQRHRQNLPWQYHNGGSWPFVGGFWVVLLARLGMRTEGWRQLERLARANSVNGWEFNEWFHGRTAEPLGMPGQSWNAAMFILARQTLEGRFRLIA